jgi:nitrite reductase/ring-hydroxylating ferredoxin subunit
MSHETTGFVIAGSATDIADGTYVIVEAGEHSVLVSNLGGEFFAVENRCSHVSSPLEGGRVRRGRIACPLHGAVYDLRTGASLAGALAPRGLRTFATRVEDGMVRVATEPSERETP